MIESRRIRSWFLCCSLLLTAGGWQRSIRTRLSVCARLAPLYSVPFRYDAPCAAPSGAHAVAKKVMDAVNAASRRATCVDATFLVRSMGALLETASVACVVGFLTHAGAEPHAVGELLAAAWVRTKHIEEAQRAPDRLPSRLGVLRQGIYHGIVWHSVVATHPRDAREAWQRGYAALCDRPARLRHFSLDCAHPMGHAALMMQLPRDTVRLCGPRSVRVDVPMLQRALRMCEDGAPSVAMAYDCAQGVFHHYAAHSWRSHDAAWWYPCQAVRMPAPCFRTLFDRGWVRPEDVPMRACHGRPEWKMRMRRGFVFGQSAGFFFLFNHERPDFSRTCHLTHTHYATMPFARVRDPSLSGWCDRVASDDTRGACVVGAAHMFAWMVGNYVQQNTTDAWLRDVLCDRRLGEWQSTCVETAGVFSGGGAVHTPTSAPTVDTLWQPHVLA